MANKHKFGALAVTAVAILTLAGSAMAAAASPVTHAKRVSAAAPALVAVPSPNGNFQDNFNPFSTSVNYGTVGMVYEPLFYFDNVSGKTFPLLGTKYAWSNHNLTLTVNLRKGVKWSDGKGFSSSDVVFTFNLLKQYPAADLNGVWSALSSVKATGPNTVVFNFKTANVPFAEYVLADSILPQHIWSKLGNPVKAVITKPIGTGPYVLSSFNTQDYKMTARADYWGGNPPVKTVDFPAYSGNDSGGMALAKGEVDWSGMFLPGIQKLFVNQNPKLNHYFFPPSNVVMLYTNLKDPLLSQLPVREAMSLAINRNMIANEGEYGYTKPATTLGLVLPNNSAWIDPALKSKVSFAYNPNKAIQILQKAGFKKNADGIFVKNGKPLSFTLQVPAGWTDWDTDCQLITNNLRAIGIQVTVKQEQIGTYDSNVTQPGSKSFQLAMSWTNTGPSPYFLYENMLNTNGNLNIEQLNNAMVNNALHNFSQTNSVSVQKQSIYKLENYMLNQLPSIPLVYGPVWFEYRTANYTGFPTAANPWINPSPYTADAQAIVLMHLKPVK